MKRVYNFKTSLKYKALYFIGLCLFFTFAMPKALPAQEAAHIGKEFYLAFPDHFLDGAELYVQAEQAANYTVTITDPTFNFTGAVSPGMPQTINLPVLSEIRTNQVIENKGIHITSDRPISVKFRSPVPISNAEDAYLGLPTTSLGKEYIILAYQESLSVRGFPVNMAPSELVVAATEDNTNISFTAKCASLNGTPAGANISITLNQGQTYQYQCGNKGDVTGTIITSDKPIAVFGANKCADIPERTAFCDYLVEQMFPTNLWGNDYFTFPLNNRTADILRIIASLDGTSITIDDGVSPTTITLDRGKFYDITTDNATHITSAQPILVAQYGRGAGASPSYRGRDPLMMLVIPTGLFLKEYRLFIPTGYSPDYLNIIAPSTAISSIKLDGQSVIGFSSLPGGAYQGAAISVTDGEHVITASEPIGVYVYGFIRDGSYGYPAGIALPGGAFSQVRVIDTISTVDIELDSASLSKTPYSITTGADKTIIEWRFDAFNIGQTEDLYLDVTLKNPVSGEKRLVNQQLEVLYLDKAGNEARTGADPQYVTVLKSAFDSAISTDKSKYQANEDILINSSITNLSEYARTIDAKVLIEDSQGALVKEITTLSNLGLASGETKNTGNLTFNTGSTYTGDYKAHLVLYQNQKEIGGASANFKIETTKTLASKIVTDKASYKANEQAAITSTIQNTSQNYSLQNLLAKVSVINSQGQGIFTEEKIIQTLTSSQMIEYKAYWNTSANAKGTYTAKLEVFEGSTALSTSTAAFNILGSSSTGAGLTGSIKAQPTPVYQGQDETISFSITNQGNEAADLQAMVIIVNPDTQEALYTFEIPLSLLLQATYMNDFTTATTHLTPRVYLAILQVKSGAMTEAKTLVSTTFEVKPGIEISKQIPDIANLLVWVNERCEKDKKDDSGHDSEDSKDKEGEENKDDNKDTKECIRIDLLEKMLKEAGKGYYIVYDKKDFQKEMRSPFYTDIIILGNKEPLEDSYPDELKEQANAGKGIISSLYLKHGEDHEKEKKDETYDRLFGLTYKGRLSADEYEITLLESPISQAGILMAKGKALKTEVEDTNRIMAWIKEIEKEEGHKKQKEEAYPGIIHNNYRLGKTLFYAFDLGQTLNDENYTQLSTIIKNSILYIHKQIDTTAFYPNQAIPLEIKIKSLGTSFDLKITEAYPAEIKLYDTTTGKWVAENPSVTNMRLESDETKTILYYALAPDKAGTYTFQTEVSYLDNGSYQFYKGISTEIKVDKDTAVLTSDILTKLTLQSLLISGDEKGKIDKAIKYIENIQQREIASSDDIDKNIHDIIKAIESLLSVTSIDMSEARLMMDKLLLSWEWRWYRGD